MRVLRGGAPHLGNELEWHVRAAIAGGRRTPMHPALCEWHNAQELHAVICMLLVCVRAE